MGHSQAEKALNRERILQRAAEQVRDTGLESISVGPLMRSVNLTHGGFYGQFSSRSALLAQALERALQDGAAASKAALDSAGQQGYAALIRSYLSRSHRDARKRGCAIAALASDVARADLGARQVMEAQLESFIARIAGALAEAGAVTGTSGQPEQDTMPAAPEATNTIAASPQAPATCAERPDDDALFAVSALVGGLLLSRVITDPARSDQLLQAVRKGLQHLPQNQNPSARS